MGPFLLPPPFYLRPDLPQNGSFSRRVHSGAGSVILLRICGYEAPQPPESSPPSFSTPPSLVTLFVVTEVNTISEPPLKGSLRNSSHLASRDQLSPQAPQNPSFPSFPSQYLAVFYFAVFPPSFIPPSFMSQPLISLSFPPSFLLFRCPFPSLYIPPSFFAVLHF